MKPHDPALIAAILGLMYGSQSTNASADSSINNKNKKIDLYKSLRDGTPVTQKKSTSDSTPTAMASGAPDPIINNPAITNYVNTQQTTNTVINIWENDANEGTQLQKDLTAIIKNSTADPEAIAAALKALTPDQAVAPATLTAQQQVTASNQVIAMHMENQRALSGMPGFNPNNSLGALYSSIAGGGGASNDLQSGGFGAFFNIKYLDMKQDQNSYTSGYDNTGWLLTLGGDYRLRENLITGVYLNYTRGQVDYWHSKGNMDNDGFGIGAYGTFYWSGGGFLEGNLGYDWNHYDLKRSIEFTINDQNETTRMNQTASSSPEAGIFHASFGGGYNFNAHSYTITPGLSLNYLRNELDSYQETMSDPQGFGGSLAMSFGKQDYTSLTSRLGVTVTTALSTNHGVFLPQLSFNWVHEYHTDQTGLTARYINDLSNTPMLILSNRPDTNYFDVGIGVAGQFSNGRSAFLSVNTLLDEKDITNYSITGGLRWEF